VVTTINALTMLPISINGYGVREGGFTRFLAPISGAAAAAAQGVAVGFLLAAQSLLWAGIGLVFWLTERRRPEVVVAGVAVTATGAPVGRISRRIAS
jgi:hypothetical protein